jgi:hypothetical protein
MKKLILPAIFGMLLFTSCKKDYTCECTFTEIDGSESVSTTDKIVLKDVTKKTVNYTGACQSFDNYNKDGVVDYKQECTLKK